MHFGGLFNQKRAFSQTLPQLSARPGRFGERVGSREQSHEDFRKWPQYICVAAQTNNCSCFFPFKNQPQNISLKKGNHTYGALRNPQKTSINSRGIPSMCFLSERQHDYAPTESVKWVREISPSQLRKQAHQINHGSCTSGQNAFANASTRQLAWCCGKLLLPQYL